MKIILIICSIFIIFCPYFLNNLHSPFELFLIQLFIILFNECLGPAMPIIYKHFPVFKRFTCASIIFAISRAFVSIITAFGFTYLVNHFGYWGLWVIMIPTIVGFAYGLLHFEKLEKVAGNYP
ncbi:MAG: hypothetical protein ACE1S7_07975 [Candidatus Tisiphia sp.]